MFERSRGEAAYHVAIEETLGREPNFNAQTDKDEIKQKLLRTMILYHYDNDDFFRFSRVFGELDFAKNLEKVTKIDQKTWKKSRKSTKKLGKSHENRQKNLEKVTKMGLISKKKCNFAA